MYRVTKTYGHDRGFSCAFRQWSSGTDCQHLHGYSLGFKVVLESPTLDVNNWVYDFGKFKFFTLFSIKELEIDLGLVIFLRKFYI